MDFRHPVWKILRILLGVGLLAWLLHGLEWGKFLHALSGTREQPAWLAAAITFTFVGLCAGVVRWHRLLRSQHLPLPFPRTFRIAFIGQFFNAFMPGACGGDVVRGVLVVRETASGNRAEAGSTVLVDRLIGLATLIVFSCACLAAQLEFVRETPRLRAPALFMLLLAVGSIVGAVLLFRWHLFERTRLFAAIEARLERVGPLIRRVYDVLFDFLNRPVELTIAILGSLANAVALSLACWAFAHALGQPTSIPDVLLLFPIITVVTSIPITPGALGLRETFFVYLFATVGMDRETAFALSILVYLGGIFWSAFGGLFLLSK